MENLLHDLRYGARGLIKNPGFTAVAVLTLALGIGANTAIFSVVNVVLLSPLPYPQPERIIQLWETDRQGKYTQGTVSPHCFRDWQQSQSFEAMATYRFLNYTLTGGDQPESLTGIGVSAEFLAVLGVKPALGRDFLPEEDQPGKNHVVILSQGLWQRRFASDPGVIGSTLQLNSVTHTIIGVMPAGFRFPESAELWTPLGLDLTQIGRGSHFLFAFGRLKAGISLSTAFADLDAIARQAEQQYPDNNKDVGVNLVPLHEQMVKGTRTGLLVLLGAVALVLLIACVNVANLMIVRATARQRELAIRSALGASRHRLIRQFLTEGILLALAGGTCGLFLAWWGVGVLKNSLPGNVPRAKEIGIDSWVLLFTLAVSLLTGILSALIPAVSTTKPNLNQMLKESGHQTMTGGLRRSVRSLLVIAEISLALVLLIGAGLLIKSVFNLQHVDTGFKVENLLTAQIALPRVKYSQERQRTAFFEQAMQRLNAISGVQSAGAVTDLPLSGSWSRSSFELEGRQQERDFAADIRVITPGYFRTMGIPLFEGRDFSEQDGTEAPAAIIINQRMAQKFWPGEDPMGRRIRADTPEEQAMFGAAPWRQVVGIVGNIRHQGLRDEPQPEMYLPYLQFAPAQMTLAVRGIGDSTALTSAVRDAVQSIDPDQALAGVRTMEQRLARALLPERFNMILLALFATLALVLAAVGVYGVISYTVTHNTREIGIRMALGAQVTDVLRLIIGQVLMLAFIGIGTGLTGALALTRLMASLLFGVTATDSMTFIGVPVLLLLVALLACYVPARRAMKVDPMVALRYE